ncbi:glutathione peroxidase [Leucobacter rhizosphaerae]|uniref:Glutathione peroxidase n=1 Tax=Leucobacter rhizosphaerae TaxID=2932245 RepID=A0ABY4FXN1_9MICO|nr:glutathione peroxidase [Leucobacter rhizosphaerae]UOQ60869.1 glutathione peroxidase [Leucobacter rhizosphaerae]
MNLRDIPLTTIDGESTTLAAHADEVVLVVNVASKCGLSPQYETLEALQARYQDRGFTVLGFPCNQFLGQEPGNAEEIKEFCSLTYGVTFPLMEKTKVNGRHKHPLYEILHEVRDADGKKGRVKWNFEKFVIAPDDSISRFRPTVVPDDPAIISVIETALPR